MPNRIIKESICRSDSIDSLSWFEEVLFYRLIVVCDDYGRFDGRPAIIKGACFPLKDDITKKHISEAIDKLSTVGLVRGYKVQGRSFLQLTTWDCHQQIRAQKSKYPSPETVNDKNLPPAGACNQVISNDINGNHGMETDNNGNQLISDAGKCPRNRESRIENRESGSGNMRATGQVCHFEDFWSAYPNKQRRHLAETAYCDLVLSGTVTEEALVSAARNYAEHVKESGDRMYMPNNWLGKCIFEDYLPGNYAKREGREKPQETMEQGRSAESREEDQEELVGDDWMNCNNELWEENVWG